MGYTDVFGGNTIYPSDVSLLHVHFEHILADVQLEWPLEFSGADYPLARIIEAHPDMPGRRIILPPGDTAGVGETVLFNNFNSLYSFEVVDFFGNNVATLPPGTCWQVYLAHNETPAGVWFAFQFGASTATVQPSALAGYGLTVTGTTLSVATPVLNFSTTGLTVAVSNRASAFVWTGTGSGVLNLPGAATAGNNFIFHVRNQGGGDLTVDPAGIETINGGTSLLLHPGDSASVFTDGIHWYTVGLGQDPVFAFDYTSVTVTGGTYVLSASEQNRIAYKFVGALTSDVTVEVPATIQQYWITNATTGAFNLFVKTVGGPPTQINQGAKGIYYSDGTNVILASDPLTIATPIVISDGGTGATTASAARLNLGISPFADPIVTATDGATVRATIEAAKLGANADITSLTALTAVTVTGTVDVTGDVTVDGSLDVTGDTTITGSLAATVDLIAGQDVISGRHLVSGPGGDLIILPTDGISVAANLHSETGNLALATNNVDRISINLTGGVGISADAPHDALEVGGNIAVANGAHIYCGYNGATWSGGNRCGLQLDGTNQILYFFSGNANRGNFDGAGNFNVAGQIGTGSRFNGPGTGLTGTAASLTAGAANHAYNIGSGAMVNSMNWNTGNWYLAGSFHGHFVVPAGSAVNIHDSTTGNNVASFPSGGRSQIGHSGSQGLTVYGEMYATQNVVAYSDRRLKTNLAPIYDALHKVCSLTGMTFDRVDTGARQTGLIAQDVAAVLPEAVSEAEDGTLALAYGNLAGLLVEAIKELSGIVETLRREMA